MATPSSTDDERQLKQAVHAFMQDWKASRSREQVARAADMLGSHLNGLLATPTQQISLTLAITYHPVFLDHSTVATALERLRTQIMSDLSGCGPVVLSRFEIRADD